jgi:hypothetical protein
MFGRRFGESLRHMITPPNTAFMYVETDIPAGMTIRDWRRARAPRYKRSLLDRLFRLPGTRIYAI